VSCGKPEGLEALDGFRARIEGFKEGEEVGFRWNCYPGMAVQTITE
jgi:hypothetical protein